MYQVGREKQEQRIIGALLRMERIKQNKGQKEICFGICVPSYLSKIEHGTVAADAAILEELFARLGIAYVSDEAFCTSYEKIIDSYLEALAYGLETADIYEKLQNVSEKLGYSRLAIYWYLIEGFQNKRCSLLLEALEENMTEQQRAYYSILRFQTDSRKRGYRQPLERAFAVLKSSYALCMCCQSYYEESCYTEVHKMENQFTALALEEGNIYTLANYYFLRGTAYACVDMEEPMMTYYERVIRMLQNTGWREEAADVYYNIGATCLSLHKYELALEYLEKVPDFTWSWHKRALAAIRKGDIEAGREFLARMQEAVLKENPVDELDLLRYEEACFECEENFLENPRYLELLERLVHSLQKQGHFGSVYFYREVLVEAYKRHRKYKKALEFQQKISSKLLGI